MSCAEKLLMQMLKSAEYAEYIGADLEHLPANKRNAFYTRKDKALRPVVRKVELIPALKRLIEIKTIEVRDLPYFPVIAAIAFGVVYALNDKTEAEWAEGVSRIMQSGVYQEEFELFQVASWIFYTNFRNGYFKSSDFETLAKKCNLKPHSPLSEAFDEFERRTANHSFSEFAVCDAKLILDLTYAERLFVKAFYYFCVLLQLSGETARQRSVIDRITVLEQRDLNILMPLIVMLYVSSEQKETFIRKTLKYQ